MQNARRFCWESQLVKHSIIAFCALSPILFASGCRAGRTVPVGNAADNIRKLALGYVQFAAANHGVGPRNQDALKKFLVQQIGLLQQDADAAFTSPRDQLPYEIFWGQRPMSKPIGHDPPKAAIIVAEKVGAGGTRYVADGQLSIRELPAAQVAELVPKAKSP